MARPKSNNLREYFIKIRMNKEERDILTATCKLTGMTHSELIRNMILNYYTYLNAALLAKQEVENENHSNLR